MVKESKSCKTYDCKKCNHYDMIIISGNDIPLNIELFFILLFGYWSTNTNVFVFPLDMITLTLLGMVAIPDLPLLGEEAMSTNLNIIFELGYKLFSQGNFDPCLDE